MTIAEYIADQLFKAGVRHVFGIPGGPSIPYMEAFRAAGIEFVLTSGEASAGIMAAVTARMTGIPGVCHATFGPGATNILTGIGEALLDRLPVIVFTSEMPDELLGRTAQMNIDHQKLFEAVSKATFRLNERNAKVVMNTALRHCIEEYPGPVHIGLPAGISEKEITESIDEIYSGDIPVSHNEIQKIIALIENSRRPLLAVGLTAKRIGLEKELLALIDRFRMPVVITPMAKGMIAEEHPCYAGVLFHALSDYLEDIYEKTDLVIGLGYDPVEFNYESWVPDVPVIHFDILETDYPPGTDFHQYTGPPDEWFSILGNLNEGSMIFEQGRVKGVRDEMESVFNGFTNHFGPAAALKILQEELPENVIMTADVGSHLHLLGQFWKTNGKDNLLMTNGWSGMGFGIPASLAVQMNDPDATVVCVTGDGGFLMVAGEMITAKRYSLPIIVVIFSDGELNLIKVKQSWKDLQPYASLLYQGDMFDSGRFLGIRVLSADSSETLRASVIEALSISEPVIINAIIDPEDYKWLIVKR
jgi:acetolactate synthase I/II/III large subunit